MRYFIDTEFIERPCNIDLISIGMVNERDEELYWINKDCNLDNASEWVMKNVLNQMPEYIPTINAFKDSDIVIPKKEIARKVLEYVGYNKPEFWGYYSCYDWVVFCWLFGPMVKLPKGWPMHCKDIRQEMDRLGVKKIKIKNSEYHNALGDAIWNKNAYEYLITEYNT